MYRVQELIGAKQLAIKNREDIREIPNNAVLLKIKRAGICGSDIEYFTHGYCGAFSPKGPLVLGHEFSGEVVSVGKEVNDFNINDCVVVDPAMPCYQCSDCRMGNNHFCTNMKFFGSASCFPHIDGGFGEYALVPAGNCLKFDIDKTSWEEVTLVEPLMVALSAVKKIGSVLDKDIAVFGGGTIGQLILSLLITLGAKSTTLIDIRDFNCNIAKQRGADAVCFPQDVQDNSFDVCIEAAGNINALRQCYTSVKKMGSIVQVGTINQEESIPVNTIMTKALTIKGSFRYNHVFALSLQLIEQKKVILKDIVTHVFSLEELPNAFDVLFNKEVNTLKVQILFEKE